MQNERPLPLSRTTVEPQGPRRVEGDRIGGRQYHYRMLRGEGLMSELAPFVEDFRRGCRRFAITSTDYKTAQQRVALALACLLDQLYVVRTAILSEDFSQGPFAELWQAARPIEAGVGLQGRRFHDHFDLLDASLAVSGLEGATRVLEEEYDLVIWDAPVLGLAGTRRETCRRICSQAEALYVVVSRGIALQGAEQDLRKHFEDFGVNVTGLVFRRVGTV